LLLFLAGYDATRLAREGCGFFSFSRIGFSPFFSFSSLIANLFQTVRKDEPRARNRLLRSLPLLLFSSSLFLLPFTPSDAVCRWECDPTAPFDLFSFPPPLLFIFPYTPCIFFFLLLCVSHDELMPTRTEAPEAPMSSRLARQRNPCLVSLPFFLFLRGTRPGSMRRAC